MTGAHGTPVPRAVMLPFTPHGPVDRRTAASGLRSGIYEGTVVHHRFEPVDHRFSYRITMTMIDLAEVSAVCAGHPLWSNEGTNAVSFRRGDYLGDPATPLDQAVRDLVETRTGRRPSGPVALLTQVRTWGWLFNPISIYYCFAPDGEAVEATVVEVTNTPWHERIAYVLPGTGTHLVAKQLHVSPFLPMDLFHRFVIGAPGQRLIVGVDDLRNGAPVFSASMVLERRPPDRRSLGRVLWRYPMMTMRVSWGIYRQALALRRKGVPLYTHPVPGATEHPEAMAGGNTP